jgi:hypothetical protein
VRCYCYLGRPGWLLLLMHSFDQLMVAVGRLIRMSGLLHAACIYMFVPVVIACCEAAGAIWGPLNTFEKVGVGTRSRSICSAQQAPHSNGYSSILILIAIRN